MYIFPVPFLEPFKAFSCFCSQLLRSGPERLSITALNGDRQQFRVPSRRPPADDIIFWGERDPHFGRRA